MSIILKGMCNFESTTVTPPKPEDIAPNVVSNVSFTDNGKGSITVKWTDPDDTVLEGVTIAKWYKTVLVYKKGSAPTSITDGQVVNNYTKNQYLYNGYPLTIDPDVTYYFKFFTVSDKNKVNTSDRSYTFSSKGLTVDPIFGNNSWETIIEVANSGSISPTWKIGDTKDLTLSGGFNETVTMQIWDFDHFDKSDGSGKAKLCLGMKNLMRTQQKLDDYTFDNSNGWGNSGLNGIMQSTLWNSMPGSIKNNIKEVKVYTSPGHGSESYDPLGELSRCRVFIPGMTEIYYDYGQSATEKGQTQFPIFTNNSSRIKRLNNGSGSIDYWWTRSPYNSSRENYAVVDTSGDLELYNSGGHGSPMAAHGVCFCFNL